jgi:multiple sugar transport system permease protein
MRITRRRAIVAGAALGAALAAALAAGAAAAAEPERIEVRVTRFYDTANPEDPTTKRLIRLMAEDPQILITQWSGLTIPGGVGRAPLMMAIAGRTAPDLMESWFHIVGNDIRQGFLYPLNEWIGDDTNGNGRIDDAEARWPRWKDVPPLWRRVVTADGKVYGIPQAMKWQMGVVYRTDMVRSAGLDANRPPETWDELIYWCQKLTDPAKDVPGAVLKRGQRGIVLVPYGFCWLPWMQAAGGDPIVQVRRSPRTGRDHAFPPEATTFVTPEGEDLAAVPGRWQANFAAPEGVAAAGLFHRLRWMQWLVDPETREPVNLTAEDLARGSVRVGERTLEFAPGDVITGVARGQTTQRGTAAWDLIGRGEAAMSVWFVQDLVGVGNSVGLDPDLLSWFPFPAGPGPRGRRVVQLQNHYAVMSEGVGQRPKAERDKVWEALEALTDQDVLDVGIRQQVLSGLARFVNPQDLRRLGFEEYLRDVPLAIQRNYDEIREGRLPVFTEPYMGFWVTMDAALNQEVVSMIISDTGEHFDYAAALAKVEHDANGGLMFGRSKEELNRYRPYARVIFGAIVLVVAAFIAMTARSLLARRAESVRQVYRGWVPWAAIGPALLLVGLWSYYPLLRGMVMAFQDYKIVGTSPWVGLDNFICLALDKSFWASLGRTVYFVALNMGLAFVAPLGLALLLSEVPRGKILFRTLFFLPQVTSGLVIALLWKLMYEPTPNGFLNVLVAGVNRFLGHPAGNAASKVLAVALAAACAAAVYAAARWILAHAAERWAGADVEASRRARLVVRVLALVPAVAVAGAAIVRAAGTEGLWDWLATPWHVASQTWLEDPQMAMLCCVIPTVWASMGMGSLIYLAALKGVPEEIYEAAEVDGAGILTKVSRITVPTLLPLIVINFVGTFIATFQNMGNIFLLTFGGPGDSTMVVGLRIWIEAYNNLRFSMATSMAWILGSLLIGFTYIQIRFLRRVEFKKAEWD